MFKFIDLAFILIVIPWRMIPLARSRGRSAVGWTLGAIGAWVCTQFKTKKDRILFRFSIGSLDQKLADFWEPGAPTIAERLACLQDAFDAGFRTSVSMEPFLGNVADATQTFHRVQKHTTGYVWLGAMKSVRRRVAQDSPEVVRRCNEIIAQQSDNELLKLVAFLGSHPKVRWKDSIRELVLNQHRTRDPVIHLVQQQLRKLTTPGQEWN